MSTFLTVCMLLCFLVIETSCCWLAASYSCGQCTQYGITIVGTAGRRHKFQFCGSAQTEKECNLNWEILLEIWLCLLSVILHGPSHHGREKRGREGKKARSKLEKAEGYPKARPISRLATEPVHHSRAKYSLVFCVCLMIGYLFIWAEVILSGKIRFKNPIKVEAFVLFLNFSWNR